MVEDLQAIADRINTGNANPNTSRALVVFNMTDYSISGVAVFFTSMSWPQTIPLPPITVSTLDGGLVASAVTGFTESSDKSGRPDRRWLNFELRFAVEEIPANGWKTYVAAYTDVPTLGLLHLPGHHGLIVVETLRHSGGLPPVGILPRH